MSGSAIDACVSVLRDLPRKSPPPASSSPFLHINPCTPRDLDKCAVHAEGSHAFFPACFDESPHIG